MSTPLSDVYGIGHNTAEDLQAHDIESAEDLATSSLDEIMAIHGFGKARALKVKKAAAAAVRAEEKPAKPVVKEEEPAPTESKDKKKKDKKEKKDKKKKAKKDKKKKK